MFVGFHLFDIRYFIEKRMSNKERRMSDIELKLSFLFEGSRDVFATKVDSPKTAAALSIRSQIFELFRNDLFHIEWRTGAAIEKNLRPLVF